MQEGLLWFDNNPELDLSDKVNLAAARYKSRVGRKATVCYVNFEEFDDTNCTIGSVILRPAVHIRPNYLWIGVDDAALPKAEALSKTEDIVKAA